MGVGTSGCQSQEDWLSIPCRLCRLDWGMHWVRGPFQPAHSGKEEVTPHDISVPSL